MGLDFGTVEIKYNIIVLIPPSDTLATSTEIIEKISLPFTSIVAMH